MPAPRFSIRANGVDITDRLVGAGMSMTITDEVGLKSDTLNLVIDDVDGSVEAPRTGAVLNPTGGYEGRMRDFGLFSVDSVIFSGWSQQITIQAKAIAAKSLTKQRDPKAYPQKDFPTYGEIFADVAARMGVTLHISAEIKGEKNTYEAQTDENSLEFLTRIGEKLNASVTVKAQNLVVVARGEGKSASGSDLQELVVARGKNLLQYSVTERDEPKHSSVEASYYDREKNKKETVEESTGMDGPKFCIRTPHQNKDDAEKAAKAQAGRLNQGTAEATFEIDGDPFAQAEGIAVVSGCRSRVDGRWSIKSVTHNFSATGPYTTSLSCTELSSQGKSGRGSSPSSTGGADGNGEYSEAGVPTISPDPGTDIA